MISKNLFFIDLEQTIIPCWDDPCVMHSQAERIRDFLHAQDAAEVHIFSFAIWNQKDKQDFVSRGIERAIEDSLQLPVMTYPSVEDMMRVDFRYSGVKFENIMEFVQMRGKKDAFIHYVLGSCDFQKAVLIDDVVPDLTVTHRKKGWSIELWNVDSL